MISSTFRLSYVRAECHLSLMQSHYGAFTAHLKVMERQKSTSVYLTGTKPRPPSLQLTALTTDISAFQSTYYFRLNCIRLEHSTSNKQKKKSESLISQLRSHKILAYFFRFQTFRTQSYVHWCINSEGICNTDSKDNRRH